MRKIYNDNNQTEQQEKQLCDVCLMFDNEKLNIFVT
jgi:hypothetical protein